MKGFCPLASGSQGNCLYFGTDQTKILIDAGISGKAIKTRLEEINVSIEDIEAILITHEHFDHIQGLRVLAFRNNIPIFCNAETAKGIIHHYKKTPELKIFTSGESFTYKDLKIHPFSVQHDASDPVGFTIQTETLKIGICTDLGFVTSLIKEHLKQCDYLYVESNHQPSMVHACSRPLSYKQRVLSRHGHLSNEDCVELLQEVMHKNLKHVYLAHLSAECNSPETALNTMKKYIQNVNEQLNLSIAYQSKISQIIHF